MATSIALPASHSDNLFRRTFNLIPGLALLTAVGYAGKFVEQSIAHYGKAHHVTLPNIEYVLWAILIGLFISNTVGIPKVFRPGLETYEFWLKAGIVLLGSRFILGDVLKLGVVSLSADCRGNYGFPPLHDRARKGFRTYAETHKPPGDWLLRLRSLGNHRGPRRN